MVCRHTSGSPSCSVDAEYSKTGPKRTIHELVHKVYPQMSHANEVMVIGGLEDKDSNVDHLDPLDPTTTRLLLSTRRSQVVGVHMPIFPTSSDLGGLGHGREGTISGFPNTVQDIKTARRRRYMGSSCTNRIPS